MSDQRISQNAIANTLSNAYLLSKFFDDYVLQKEYYPYQFDGWKDKKYYGLVNNKKSAIYPKNSIMALNSNSNNISYKNLMFVVDAFNEMKKYHQSFLYTNRFNSNGSIYINLDIKKAGLDVNDLYVSYMNSLYNIFNNFYLSDSRKNNIKDFSSFIKIFLSFIKTMGKIIPFTRSSFIQSDICDPSANGLCIQFETGVSFTDIKTKANKYISDPNFDIFLDSAKRHGFYVDKNAPWRIIADLESPAMKQYYRKYNYYTVDDVLNNCYHIAYYSDVDVLKNILISFWNTYANNNQTSVSQNQRAGCSSLFAEITSYSQLSVETFDKIYGQNWLLRLYLFTKIYEKNINITQSNFEILYEEVAKLNKYVDEKNALDYIERKMQELSQRGMPPKTNQLTTPDDMIRMLSLQQNNVTSTEINF